MSQGEFSDTRAELSDESKLTAETLQKKMGGHLHDDAAEDSLPLAPQPDVADHNDPPSREPRPPRKPSRQWY